MPNQVMHKLIESIGVGYYSIMCDEYIDISNKEQLSFCIHLVKDNLCMFEKFLEFYEIPSVASDTIATVIKHVLIRYQRCLDKFRGQFYDGTNGMVG